MLKLTKTCGGRRVRGELSWWRTQTFLISRQTLYFKSGRALQRKTFVMGCTEGTNLCGSLLLHKKNEQYSWLAHASFLVLWRWSNVSLRSLALCFRIVLVYTDLITSSHYITKNWHPFANVPAFLLRAVPSSHPSELWEQASHTLLS